ncbi:MAG TPA: hypothetical protein VN759_04865 [Pseudolysinimonas sp.]|nr:hypothetical protein [Pseudolysinimonas sp.]
MSDDDREPWDPAATQPLDASPEPEPAAPDAPIDLISPTAANELLAAGLPEPVDAGPTSAVDALFGADRFQDYEADPPPAAPPVVPAPAEHRSMSRAQRTALAVAGGVLALAVLVALFFIGTRLPHVLARSTPSPTPSVTPTPTPAPTVLPAGPVAAGVHRWDQLLGGECLDPFTSPWAQTFTVVDCAAPHPAQLVFRGRFADPATPGYPGATALQQQMSVLCSAPGVIDLAAAAPYTDAQLQAGYPATAAQWDAGDHWYYCFVNRSSGQPLTASIAGPRPAPSATPAG